VVLTQGEHDPNNTVQFSPRRNGAQGHLQSEIVVWSNPGLAAIKEATQSIPVVFTLVGDRSAVA
jgi:hypothetical protein